LSYPEIHVLCIDTNTQNELNCAQEIRR